MKTDHGKLREQCQNPIEASGVLGLISEPELEGSALERLPA
jgi:hypothetical protein